MSIEMCENELQNKSEEVYLTCILIFNINLGG